MSIIDEITEQLRIGKPIFNELFKLSDKALKKKLGAISGVGIDIGGQKGIRNHYLFQKEGQVDRVIRNEEPHKIEIYFYDGLVIDWMGISFKPEHGDEHRIVNFNKNFKL